MIHWLKILNLCIFSLFFLSYFYQFCYAGIRFVHKMPVYAAKRQHRFAVLIAARNEENVIGGLLKSVKAQKYPQKLIDVYVVADNCTDATAVAARKLGATVFERSSTKRIGKSYVLDYALHRIEQEIGIEYYDGYFVFDADNVLDENFVREMNNVFDSGYRVVTSYRNSKNYGYNWISAGYALWFLRESKYLNGARMMLGTSCAISGTGFLVSSAILKKDGGWKYDMLTEDIEFTTDKVIRGEKIGYCEKAVLYDEQPVDFDTSWTQRMRWTKGFYQVIGHYGRGLVRGCVKEHRFQCFDMLATIAPATLLTIAMMLLNSFAFVYGLFEGTPVLSAAALECVWDAVRNIYLTLFFFGGLTVVTEWKNIYCSPAKKIGYLFTFPIFMFTYFPIAIAAIFKRVTWTPVRHSFSENVNQIKSGAKRAA